ncbi:MAG: hypothetical protein MI974_21750 [Chitinophagales bacterium]|nr:hypothetical protein [Chitinophagales bacterium]
MKLSKMLVVLMAILSIAACEKDDPVTPTGTIDEGNDPNFKIVANNDAGLTSFNRKVVVFDIPIYAVSTVEDAKLLHAANVMAQYLDNDEDGTIDNQQVVNAMIANKAFMVMWKSESDLNIDPPSDRLGQDLGNDETHPSFVANGKTGAFDATLEEVLHIITHAGYAEAYPDIFGETAGTALANAMDIARGGHFVSIPNPYPSEAWYTYDDSTCDYNCMATEYIYWALTSILGAQDNRLNEIQQEWKLNTKDKVQQTDVAIYQLLNDSQYKFPTVLPDGTYRR